MPERKRIKLSMDLVLFAPSSAKRTLSTMIPTLRNGSTRRILAVLLRLAQPHLLRLRAQLLQAGP